MRFVTPGLSGAPDDVAAGVRDRPLELAPHDIGLVEHEHRALLGAARRGHLALGLLEVAHAGADRRDAVLGDDEEVLAEARVEPRRDVAHELEVLALVLPDRDLGRPVGEHVGRLQHRVEQQPGRHELALLRGLVAELVHAVELAERGDRAQQPAKLGVLLHVALAEEHAPLGVQAGGDEHGGGVVDALAQLARLVGDRDRVQVHDAVDRRIAAVLALHVLPDGPDVVPEVLAPRRLDAREDPHPRDVSRSAPGPRRPSS